MLFQNVGELYFCLGVMFNMIVTLCLYCSSKEWCTEPVQIKFIFIQKNVCAYVPKKHAFFIIDYIAHVNVKTSCFDSDNNNLTWTTLKNGLNILVYHSELRTCLLYKIFCKVF